MAHRIDRGELRKPTKLPNGWLRVDGLLTRTGVFTYTMPDGSKRRELRLPEEVFDPEALASFGLVPLTDAHPPTYLNADNAREYTAGAVSPPVREGDFVRASILVTDATVIAKLEGNVARELSCGYSCELDEKPGVTSDGQRYDSIQRKIRGNHVAVVERGRAGPEARVRMDAGEALDAPTPLVLRSEKTPEAPEAYVRKIKIDGVEFEVTSDAAAQAYENEQRRQAAALEAAQKATAAATAKAESLQAKLDAAGAEIEAKKKELAEVPAKLRAEAAARMQLEQSARKVLGAEAKFDGLTDDELRARVLKRLAPKLEQKGRTPEYLRARFDSELERFTEADGEADDVEEVDDLEEGDHTDDAGEEDSDEDAPTSSAEAYERQRRASADAYKATLKAHGIT